ncbi:hypothetical protein N658DRAFT_236731 [Parathielavia hyrcaniae]|uniref:Uncharacterized protein n=1 Tax=Parathielavia hyrcaniae TaxID=113614 RepID=A0AAN6QB30_9PEZI|nr:hypothetical protein N658DRAFT_236731 [Parathielavia hyrcaniae]
MAEPDQHFPAGKPMRVIPRCPTTTLPQLFFWKDGQPGSCQSRCGYTHCEVRAHTHDICTVSCMCLVGIAKQAIDRPVHDDGSTRRPRLGEPPQSTPPPPLAADNALHIPPHSSTVLHIRQLFVGTPRGHDLE